MHRLVNLVFAGMLRQRIANRHASREAHHTCMPAPESAHLYMAHCALQQPSAMPSSMYSCNAFQPIAIIISGRAFAWQQCGGKPYLLMSVIIIVTVCILAQAV